MGWFNAFGLILIIIIMIPNVIFAVKRKNGFVNKWHNKAVEIIEQIGRLGCFVFMIFNVPGTCFGWWFNEAFLVYLIVNSLLVVLYCTIWAICWNKSGVFRALTLSIIPSAIFLFSSVIGGSILLLIASLLFAPTHILISYKNAK